MIEFYALMYNVTAQAYLDLDITKYSIAEYIEPYTTYDNPFITHERTTITTIPSSDYSVNAGTNIGIRFEYYAKQYYVDNSAWPVLRLLTTSSTDDYYLEWTHNNPNGFYIKAGDTSFWWDSALQWSDTIAQEGSPAQYYSYVFVTAGTISQLNNFTELIFGGAYHLSNDTETLVCDSKSTFTCSPPWKLITDANTLLLTRTTPRGVSTNYYKTYNGTAYCRIAKYKTSDNYYRVYAYLIAPNANQSAPATANGSELPPWSVLTSNSSRKYVFIYPADGFRICYCIAGDLIYENYTVSNNICPIEDLGVLSAQSDPINVWFNEDGYTWIYFSNALYTYLTPSSPLPPPEPPVPPSDVDPDNIPDPDEPPAPQPPDNPDPYYDPTSDPDSPEYDPTKDPSSPDYDPDTPHTPFNPPSTEGGGGDPDPQPPQDEIPAPETPPSYVTTNALFTLYNPAAADLTNLANFLWSPAWSIDTFKKIFANPLDCILGLMVMPYLAVDVGTKNMNVGNIDTGVAMRYFTKQFYDFDCGNFTITEFYQAYLDYAPYTKVSIFLPYIGDQQLNTDEVMNKTLNVKYRFDLATGDCVAFISVDGSVLYSFSGNCAARLPLSSNNYGGLLPSITGAIVAAGSMAAGVPALGAASALAVSSMKQDIRHTGSISGSAGLMGVQTPYLIITRPRQALPLGQNSFMGYPSFITESLGGLTGYTEVESCHLEHVPCTDEELREIENLLKGGVLF